MRDIGKNIRSLRIQKGMTQEQFAEKLFVTRQTVSNYETGKSRPDIEMVMQIAQVLETDANTVLYGPQTMSNRERDLRALFISGVICLILTVLIVLFSPIAKEWGQTRFWIAPIALLRTTLVPAQKLFLGWTAMHGLWVLLKIKPLQYGWCMLLRRMLLWLTTAVLLSLLPYVLYSGLTTAGYFLNTAIRFDFSFGGLYKLWVPFVMKYPNLFAVLGALLRIFEIPGKNE